MSDDRAGTASTGAPVAGEPDATAGDHTREHQLRLLHEMLRIRRFEEKCAELYSAGKIRGFLHLYIGEEAVAVGAMQALRPAGRRRRDVPRARSCAGARHFDGSPHGRDVRQTRRL